MKLLLPAALTAFLVAWLLGPVVIPMLHKLKFGQIERELGPESHKKKQGTPTMGGIMILAGIVVASLVFGHNSPAFLFPSLIATLGFGLIGFLDDFIKIKLHRNLGLRAYQKIIGQFAFAILIAIWAYRSPYLGSTLYLPISGGEVDIGIYYIPLVVFTVIAEVNAVNLTDGLDGLASNVTMIYSFAMVIAFMVLSSAATTDGQHELSASLDGMGVFSIAIAGACLGFLVHNTYPAKVFMGDTGALALGGAVSMIAICSKSFLLVPIMGFCFVGSALSVILQIATNHLCKGNRIFKMAPIHHHFELCGYSETHIVSMYSIATTVLCAVCLLSYLLR